MSVVAKRVCSGRQLAAQINRACARTGIDFRAAGFDQRIALSHAIDARNWAAESGEARRPMWRKAMREWALKWRSARGDARKATREVLL